MRGINDLVGQKKLDFLMRGMNPHKLVLVRRAS
jgi:hypothetical protein